MSVTFAGEPKVFITPEHLAGLANLQTMVTSHSICRVDKADIEPEAHN